jgi:hypothetical protein
MFYFSPSTRGFYCDAVHGARVLKVLDPAWVPPEDAPDAEPALLDVVNTAVPADVVEVSDKEHATLMAQQSAGRVLGVGAKGRPVALDPAPLTIEERVGALRLAVSDYLDAAAKAKGYDNIINAALRAAYPGPYRAEGTAFATWMDATWQACYGLLAKFGAGELAEPSVEELVSMLPKQPAEIAS